MAEPSRGSCEALAPDRPELPNSMSRSVTLAAGDAAGKSFLRSFHSRDLVRRGNLPVAVAEQDDQERSAALDLGEADLEHLDLTGGFVGFAPATTPSRRSIHARNDAARAAAPPVRKDMGAQAIALRLHVKKRATDEDRTRPPHDDIRRSAAASRCNLISFVAMIRGLPPSAGYASSSY